jgi:hypothetical protein
MNSVQTTHAPACLPTFASGARAFIYVRACLLAMTFAIVFSVALAAPSAVAQTTTPQYLFLSTSVPNGQGAFVAGIVTYTVDTTTGALTQITPPPVQTRGAPGALAINNAGTFLFAAGTNSAGEGAVESFNVASDGSLSEVGTSPFTVSNPQAAPITIAVSPNGAYVYVASSVPFNESTGAPQSTIVDVFAVAANGSLTLSNTFAYSAVQACDNTTPAQLTPIQFFVHPTQKWLYLFMGSSFGPPCSGQPSEIQQFTINSDGTITSPGPPSILPLYATNGYALTGSPDGTLLFLMTKPEPENGIIYASGIDQITGGIGFVLAYRYPMSGPNPVLSTGGLAVDSTSTYLYSSAGTFLIQDGTITALVSISSPYTAGASLLASPSLPFIFAQTSAPDSNPVFLSDQVNSDGSLTPAPGSPYAIAGSGVVLSGAAPIPTKAVMWIQPDSPIDITGVAVGQMGTDALTISNMGYGPLTLTSVTVTGDPSLTPSNQCTSPVAPQGFCSTGVNFTPTSVGTFTGTLTIESSASTRTFAISATSVAPPPPMADPILIAPSPILFPDTATGSTSALTYQLQNGSTATEPMTVSSITIVGSNPGDFSQTSNCTSTPIAVGSSCSITITFAPQALGGRAATLSINGPSGALTGSALTGTAVTTVTKFTFSASVIGPGTVTQSPTGASFPNNTTITLTETPNANSSFVNWTGATCTRSGATTCTVVLNSNAIVTANFATNVTLTTSVVGPGTITQSPTGTSFAPGSEVVLTAFANAGATFVSWTSSSACVPSTVPTVCIVTLSANTTVTATFSGGQFSLATNVVGPGTITQSPTGTSFASGTAITLTAVPTSGSTFTSWSGGACSGSTSTICAFNISANTSVTATFAAAQYTLTTTVSGPGTITQSPTGASFNSGTSITLTAVPAANASFTSWSGACAASTNSVCTFAISANTSVTATFTASPAVTPSQPSQTGSAGSAFTFQINETGFSTKPTLAATCSIPAGGCTISGSTLTVTTTARPSSAVVTASIAAIPAPPMRFGGPSVPPANARRESASLRLTSVLSMGILLLFVVRRARRILPVAALVGGLALLAACGGSGTGGTPPTSGTPAGTYSVTVTATAGPQTATTVVSVVVQ